MNMKLEFVLCVFTAAIACCTAASLEQNFTILTQTFSKHKRIDEGYSERVVGFGGVIGLQRTIRQDGSSLRIREITNGSLIVQLMFSPSHKLSDCDVSNSRHHIHRLLRRVSIKQEMHAKYISINTTSDNDLVNLTNISEWMDRCNAFHAEESAPTFTAEGEEIAMGLTISEDRRSKVNTESAAVTKKSVKRNERQKRGLTDLIYSGTKWCGKGNTARNYQDLGENKHTDRCCRAHDHCKIYIMPMSTAYNYFNFGLFPVCSCECDKEFQGCLHRAADKHNDTLADWMGDMYFNYIGMECFNLEEQDQCTQRSYFWRYCLKTEKVKTAIFNEVLTYETSG